VEDFKEMDQMQKLDVLKYSQVGFISVVIIQFAIHLAWELATLVPGFTRYDGGSAMNANTHAGWWMVIDLCVLCWGIAAPFFTLHYTRNGTIEKGVMRTHQWLLGYMILAGIGAVVSLVHFILTMGELIPNCDSTLCAQYQWCFIALLVFLVLHIFVLLWSLLRALAYYHNLKAAVEGGLELDVSGSNSNPDTADEMYNDQPPIPRGAGDASAPKGNGATFEKQISAAATPLLQARYTGKIQHVASRKK
jgi:hypothetical protein